MTSATRVSVIGVLLIGVLSLPVRASAQARPPIADQIAQTYGFGSWSQVDAVRFTFALDGGPKLRFHRSWIWEPKLDQITYDGPDKDGKPIKVTYKRSELAKQSDFVKTQVDPGFFNDSYWLLFPFHMIWDTGATITDAGKKKMPSGKGSARNVVVQYPSDGGFTPGDTWSLFVGPDNRIQELAFKHGGAAKPGVVFHANPRVIPTRDGHIHIQNCAFEGNFGKVRRYAFDPERLGPDVQVDGKSLRGD